MYTSNNTPFANHLKIRHGVIDQNEQIETVFFFHERKFIVLNYKYSTYINCKLCFVIHNLLLHLRLYIDSL